MRIRPTDYDRPFGSDQSVTVQSSLSLLYRNVRRIGLFQSVYNNFTSLDLWALQYAVGLTLYEEETYDGSGTIERT